MRSYQDREITGSAVLCSHERTGISYYYDVILCSSRIVRVESSVLTHLFASISLLYHSEDLEAKSSFILF